MKRRIKIVILIATVVVVGTILVAVIWHYPLANYVPIIMNDRQQLVEDSSLPTAEQLDALEVVLKRYSEPFVRVDATHLRISPALAHDRELLWNYTSKSQASLLTIAQASDAGSGLPRDLGENEIEVIGKRIDSSGGSKYSWDKVEVVSVPKNPRHYEIGGTILVAHYGWSDRVPDKNTTLRLAPYNPKDLSIGWRLVGVTPE